MELSLSKVPWHVRVAAFVLVAAGAIGSFEYFYAMGVRAELAERQAQLDALKAEISKGLATAKQLSSFETDVADLESRLDNLKAILPEEKDAADLLRRMQTVAAQSSLVIKSFKPAPVVTKELHAEWPITLELEGSYHNLATFFDRVGKFTRIVNISGLDIKGQNKATDPNATITATAVATTFVLLDSPALAKAAAAKAKAAKAAADAAAAKKAA
jgi:type IV pilus assembly protein PilO